MKFLKRLKLNTRLLLVFFTAVFLLSLGHFFVYSHLLNTMVSEENAISVERMNSTQIKLDAVFRQVEAAHDEMIQSGVFRYPNTSRLSAYNLWQMYMEANKVLSDVDYVHGWTIYLRNTDWVVSNNGCYTRTQYDGLRSSQTYPAEFWIENFQKRFYRAYYPEAGYVYRGSDSQYEEGALLPVAMKSTWNDNMLTVLFLDIDAICESGDAYLENGFYIFSNKGELLYCADEEPLVTQIPEEQPTVNGERYTVQQRTAQNGLQYVKLVPESQAAGLLRNSFFLCLAVALSAIAIIVVLVPASVNRLMDPVDRMLGLLRQHSEPKENNTVHGAFEELQQILKMREQQEAAIAKRDATLSEYFLHSRLKNVYVDMERQDLLQDGIAFILYIQVHYQEKSRGCFSMSRAELENLLQEMMSSTLSSLFETTMVFQLEPGRFAARVTLAPGDDVIDDEMKRFMARLEQEREFAWFTVVQSEALKGKEDLASVYNAVQDAARLAQVCDHSQLLTLPVAESGAGFVFARQDEQKLHDHICAGETLQAVALAEHVLDANLRQGISRAQMEILCVAVVNTVAHAMTELAPSAEKIAAASGVYNVLTVKCSTAAEYKETVTDFIRSATPDSEVQPVEDDQLLNKVQQYLRENYHREFSSEEMANALWVSRSYLSSYYKSKTGMNLSDSIQLYRVQRAVELLKDPDVKIGDIGPLVGIPSSNTFLRQFRKYTGMTPKEYRLQNIE